MAMRQNASPVKMKKIGNILVLEYPNVDFLCTSVYIYKDRVSLGESI